MKIKEILELTQHETVAYIAKTFLDIGEKPTREALKAAGAYSIVGKKGWYMDDDADPANLEKSIYEFAEQVEQEKKEAIQRLTANVQTKEDLMDDEILSVFRKRFSFDLDPRLVKELKIRCVAEEKNLYEAVEEAIRDYLNK